MEHRKSYLFKYSQDVWCLTFSDFEIDTLFCIWGTSWLYTASIFNKKQILCFCYPKVNILFKQFVLEIIIVIVYFILLLCIRKLNSDQMKLLKVFWWSSCNRKSFLCVLMHWHAAIFVNSFCNLSTVTFVYSVTFSFIIILWVKYKL